MSSPSDNRDRSRLFNLIPKQSRFFGDLLGLGTRQLKVATSWSVEVMPYPRYKLWKTIVESSGKKLSSHQSEDPSDLSQLENNSSTQTLPSVDMAVLRVKKVVEKLQSKKIQQRESKFVDPTIINNVTTTPFRGIASRISVSTSCANAVHQLVLVTAENQILDILTPQQQHKLQGVIIAGVDNYWKARHLSEIEKPQPFLLKISRLFEKLTSGKSKTEALPAASTDVAPIDIKQAINKHRSSFTQTKHCLQLIFLLSGLNLILWYHSLTLR